MPDDDPPPPTKLAPSVDEPGASRATHGVTQAKPSDEVDVWDEKTVPIPHVAPEVDAWMARQHEKIRVANQRIAALHDYTGLLQRELRMVMAKVDVLEAIVARHQPGAETSHGLHVEFTQFKASLVGESGDNGILGTMRATTERLQIEVWGTEGRKDDDKPVVVEARAGRKAVNRLMVLAAGSVVGAIGLAYAFGTSGSALKTRVDYLESQSFSRIPEFDRELTVLREHVTRIETDLAKTKEPPP